MVYKDELKKAMHLLAEDERTIFMGQTVAYKGTAIFGTLEGISDSKRIELPVFENTQTGMALGMGLAGLVPVSIYPRFDFLVEGFPQLINHLDKIKDMSNDRVNPRIILRTSVGSQSPLYPGEQHIGDYSAFLRRTLKNVRVETLHQSRQIVSAYEGALKREGITLLVEYAEKYNTE